MKSDKKKRVVIFIDWFLPAFRAGGPIQSVASFVEHLHSTFDIFIVTSNIDIDGKPLANIKADTWTEADGCRIFYASKKLEIGGIRNLLKSTDFDIVYINSLFSFRFALLPILTLRFYFVTKPVILAPRGMLSRGALAIKKQKKAIFIFFTKLLGFYKNVHWHATSPIEKREIEEGMKITDNISIIQNLPKSLGKAIAISKEKDELRLCYISRISEIKNLLFAIQCIQKLKNCKISFDIYGPIESEIYWEVCKTEMNKSPDNFSISYFGAIEPFQVQQVLADHHVFFLPTLNENYGHSIVEALLSARPTIISDRTPWNDLQAHNAGFALPLENQDAFIEAISYFCKMNQDEYDSASKNARNYIDLKIDTTKITAEYVKLFNRT